MSNLAIQLDRLELVAATQELLEAEDDLRRLVLGLKAIIPGNWPMPLYDSDARNHFRHVLSERPVTGRVRSSH